MAKVAAVPVQDDNAAPPKKSKLKLIIIALVAVLLLGGGAAAYFLVLAPGGAEGEAEKVAEPEVVTPPSFAVLDPFVVNLAKPDQNRYLQVGITYELKDSAAADDIKNFTPIIRSRILMVLSGKNIESLTTIQGKQRLMDELVDLARLTIKGDGIDPTKGVRDVHFSSFVIQ